MTSRSVLIASAILVINLIGLGCTRLTRVHCGKAGESSMAEMMRRIANSDVEWQGTYFGLWPELHGASEEALPHAKHAIASLIEVLKDEQRFVAAHVLLTIVTQANLENSRDWGEKWNGLRVEIYGDGRINFPGGQQAELIRLWGEWHRHAANKHLR